MAATVSIKERKPESSFPVTIKEVNHSYFFGAIRIRYIIEDRRPDLEYKDGKYKHLIYFNIFWKKFSWVMHTTHPCDENPFTR